MKTVQMIHAPQEGLFPSIVCAGSRGDECSWILTSNSTSSLFQPAEIQVGDAVP